VRRHRPRSCQRPAGASNGVCPASTVSVPAVPAARPEMTSSSMARWLKGGDGSGDWLPGVGVV
jgi:hypothetical protein